MILRFLIFFFGLCILSLGIATVTNAGLGTGTVSAVAFVLNHITDLSMGFFVCLTNIFFFVLQIIVDRRAFFQKALRQLPICCVFGFVFDVALWVSGHIVPQNYIQQILMAFAGSVLTGLGIASSHGKEGFDDSFGFTALCSIGPILSVIVIAAIMKATGQSLPSVDDYVDPLSSIGPNLWANIGHAWLDSLYNVALSVGPLLLFFLIYQFAFIRLPRKKLLRIVVGIVIVYFGLVMFLSAVEYGFMPIASKLGQTLGSSESFVYIALILGGLFGLFGVLAEPAVHVLVDQIETVSDGTVKKKTMLLVMSLSIGTAVCLQIIRAYFQFDLMYYLIPGYIIAFVLSFLVPKIYTAIAFDSGGVASGPMTSTFILPFCIGFAYAQGEDPYLYGFGLVAMVAMMPIIVVQAMGLVSTAKIRISVSKTRKLLIQEGDDQVIHFPLGGSEDGKEAI